MTQDKSHVPAVPSDAPKAGEVYQHYKSDHRYRVVDIALHSDDTWHVVYEPMYEGAVAKLFTRPLAEWRQVVEWQGAHVERFVRVG